MPLGIFNEIYPIGLIAQWGHDDWDSVTSFYAANGNGGRIDSLQFSNTDSIDHSVALVINGYGFIIELGEVLIPARSGFDGLPLVDAMTNLGSIPAGGIILTDSFSISGAVTEIITAAQHVNLWGQGGTF